jgi:glyoxylase I family protein
MRRTGVDHFDLVVSSLGRSLPVYRDLLGPVGYTNSAEIVGERGERVVYLSGSGVVPFSLREAQVPGSHDRYSVGLHHVAFEASSREMVDLTCKGTVCARRLGESTGPAAAERVRGVERG